MTCGSLWDCVGSKGLEAWFLVLGSHFHLMCSLVHSSSPQLPDRNTIYLPKVSLSTPAGHLLDKPCARRRWLGHPMEEAQMPPSDHSTSTQSHSCRVLLYIQRTASLPHSSVTWLPIPHYVSSEPKQPDSELQTFFSLPDRHKPGVHLNWQTGSTEHVRKADPDQGTELGHLNLTDIHSIFQHNSYAFRNHQEAKTQQNFFFPTQRPFSTFREFLCLS